MPTYCYSNQSGEVIERFYPIGNHPKHIRVGGVKYERDIGAENGHRIPTGEIWPILSDGAGVHPSQIQEAREAARKSGVPTEFARDGRAILRTRKHRRDYLRTRGLHDQDGGYGET